MKLTHIKLYKDGVPIDKMESLDFSDWWSKYWILGVWDYSPNVKVWGLRYHTAPTQMSYALTPSPKELIEQRLKKDDGDPVWQRWYFDVGNKIYAELADLIPALEELGIWE